MAASLTINRSHLYPLWVLAPSHLGAGWGWGERQFARRAGIKAEERVLTPMTHNMRARKATNGNAPSNRIRLAANTARGEAVPARIARRTSSGR